MRVTALLTEASLNESPSALTCLTLSTAHFGLIGKRLDGGSFPHLLRVEGGPRWSLFVLVAGFTVYPIFTAPVNMRIYSTRSGQCQVPSSVPSFAPITQYESLPSRNA